MVKEADAFYYAGYEVTVLYNFVAEWAQALDKDILIKAKYQYIQVGGINKSTLAYQLSRIKFAFFKFINENISKKFFPENAHARCYTHLLKKAVELKADWYIGHNPGAIAIAANAAHITKTKAGFDFEDYHRGEFNDMKNKQLRRQIFIEEKYISDFRYITAASPMIAKAISNDFPYKSESIFNLFNVFPLKQQPSFKDNANSPLSLLWFSQHVGKDRGIEQIVRVLKSLNDRSIKLILIGNCTEDVKSYFLKMAGGMASSIFFKGILTVDQLVETSSHCDVGFATELSVPLNRDICLTNKIFTYLLAGNAIIFSNTSAQYSFNKEYKVGHLFNNDKELEESIIFYKNKENLLAQRKYNYQLAKEKLNWENESQKLLTLVH